MLFADHRICAVVGVASGPMTEDVIGCSALKAACQGTLRVTPETISSAHFSIAVILCPIDPRGIEQTLTTNAALGQR
jgi:hypothetical protein